MSTRSLRAIDREQKSVTRAEGSRGAHPVVPALCSALLLWFSFPPASWGWLAWVALAPLFLLVRSERSRWAIYCGAWAGGLLFWLLSIHWVRLTDPTAWLAWLVMALFLSLWWPAFLFVTRLAVRRLKLPMMVAAPVVWVGLEFLRAFVLTGFPWYYLAHSQYRYLHLIQISDFSGSLGLSFLVAMANACWVDLLTRPLFRPTPRGTRLAPAQALRLTVLALSMAATLGYGAYRLSTAQFRTGPRLALLQSNIKQEYKTKRSPEEILATYQRLVVKALSADPPPDLIVWPETSYPYGFVALDPLLDSASFAAQVKSLDSKGSVEFWLDKLQRVSSQLHGWVDSAKIPMLVGSLYYDFHRTGLSRYNAAILFEPGSQAIQTYFKLHLVPFGEYVPLIQTFPWLIALTPFRGTDHVPGLSFGREPRWFDMKGVRFATAICFEDSLPDVVRRFFAETRDGHPPDILINISNDGWFQWSDELDMHLAVSVFRAVENRVPLARAVNTGISALIDGNGRIDAQLPKNTEGVLVGSVWLDDRVSMYTSWGDWPGQACLLISIGLLPLGLGQFFYKRPRGDGKSRVTPSPSLPLTH